MLIMENKNEIKQLILRLREEISEVLTPKIDDIQAKLEDLEELLDDTLSTIAESGYRRGEPRDPLDDYEG